MKTFKLWGVGATISLVCLLTASLVSEAGTLTAGKTHIGTFDGSTTFMTSSSNGINPGLFIEVRDADGNLKQYESEDGVITVSNTKEGAYVTQTKLLGKTKYVDQSTGEVLDQWEDGRNLKLESSESPALMTESESIITSMTRNQFINRNDGVVYNTSGYARSSNYISVAPNDKYYVRFNTQDFKNSFVNIMEYNDTSFLRTITLNSSDIYFVSDDCTRIRVSTSRLIDGDLTVDLLNKFRLTISKQSNLLTVNEDIVLRSLPNGAGDTLNLMTGEHVQHIGEVLLDGSSDEIWRMQSDVGNGRTRFIITNKTDDRKIYSNQNKVGYLLCDKFKEVSFYELFREGKDGVAGWEQGTTISFINGITVLSDFISLISQNPINLQYELQNPVIKPIELNSTYQFNLVSDSVVKISGEVIPTIYSITVPSEPLTFVLNPNAEEGQQFIAPEFQITNQSPGPIQLELKAFEQITNLFNDVLPDQHDDWSQLNKEESKDIALALVPKPSDAWLTLHEGPKYVADSTNLFLGEIRKNATVEFSFSALHGGVFDLSLFPEYRLVFTFGF